MKQSQTYVINFKGGIVPVGHLNEILELLSVLKIESVRFGLRQEMIVEVPGKSITAFTAACKQQAIHAVAQKKALPNIVSSYAGANIFNGESWVREGLYKDVFELFDYESTLKINICEQQQTFVPFFTGNINFIASGHTHYWYVYIRFPKTQTLYCLPELVYTDDIVLVAKQAEKIILKEPALYVENKNANGNSLFEKLKTQINFIGKKMESPLRIPKFSLPYYEGFNKAGNEYWLGVYRRDEWFSVAFLKDICSVCIETKTAQLYTTNWKGIIIKNIDASKRNLWDYILGRHRINVRHAANELNWQVEDHTEEGLILKRLIIRHFDKADVRTYGLCFAIETRPASMFGTVVIRKTDRKNPGRLKSLERFDILYTKDFNPNNPRELVLFRKDVMKEHIGTYLVSLCKLFYDEESREDILQQLTQQTMINNNVAVTEKKIVYQCKDCLSIYDEQAGDIATNILPNTPFDALDEHYCCPLCEAPKDNFVAVDAAKLQLG